MKFLKPFVKTVSKAQGISSSVFLVLLFCKAGMGASICVSVSDPARLPLWNAAVTVIGLTIEKQASEQSDRNGIACINGLPEGLYSVEVSLTGFLNVRYYPIRLGPDRVARPHFTMPLGEIGESFEAQEALLSGTLKLGDSAVSKATICLKMLNSEAAPKCTESNEIGEYAFSVLPGKYRAEVVTNEKVFSMLLDLSSAGYYRNRILLK